jgi:hypothetical protein
MTKADEQWVDRVQHWKEGGKSAEEFAAGQPYKASTLKWKARELRRRAEQADQGQTTAGSVRMARVVPTRSAGDGRVFGGLVVEVSGARISLSRGFDALLLSDVVRALGGVR